MSRSLRSRFVIPLDGKMHRKISMLYYSIQKRPNALESQIIHNRRSKIAIRSFLMPRSKPVKIGKRLFPSIQAARDHIRLIIARTLNSTPLQGEDAEFALELFKRHPRYKERQRGRKIAYFLVSFNKGGTRCFYVVYSNGTKEDFSFKKCLNT